jgi:hypothetical protein
MPDGAHDTRYGARLIALNNTVILAENEQYRAALAIFACFMII